MAHNMGRKRDCARPECAVVGHWNFAVDCRVVEPYERCPD
jgi:hypothetical protein